MNSPQHNATSISAFNISNVYYIIEIGMTVQLLAILYISSTFLPLWTYCYFSSNLSSYGQCFLAMINS